MVEVTVQISALVTVVYPDGTDDHTILFDIEDNHCPGTGIVGLAVNNLFKKNEESDYCEWCNHGG